MQRRHIFTMATNTAILDDRDPLIQYAGTWSGGGSYLEFSGTTSFALESGSTASLSFVGTSVSVYATVGVEGASQASIEFVVDDSITGKYVAPNLTATIHHELLWGSPTLSNGTHTLVITQGVTPASTSGVICIDYIMYDTTSTFSTYFIDDRDRRITYSPGWVQDGSDGDFQHTSQRTSAPGESFTLEFEGQSIAYYGGMTSRTINATAVIDGGPPTFFGLPPGAMVSNNPLFQSGNLSAGTHKLVVTAEDDQNVWADYFLVNPTTGTPTSNSAFSPSSGAASSTSSGAVSSPSLPTSSSSSPPTTLSSPHKSTAVGAIIGGVVGIVAVLAVLAVAIFLFKRRRGKIGPSMLSSSEESRPMPFVTFPASGTAPMWPNYYHFQGVDDTAVGFPDPRAPTKSSGPPVAPIAMLPSRKLMRMQDTPGYTGASSSRPHSFRTSPGSSGQSEEPPQYIE
ncbi:hypothetical protein MSAN_01322800 [Mycena sanguinolenta]|uniref:Transmembrane protein n=1 Tax=Mycena sanguinolenta TaxID=230812 RepID=A0A8H6YFE3_9AGAR|nr:hypothetical protein MSAN_01322800 [Mycena sanguinolenta]